MAKETTTKNTTTNKAMAGRVLKKLTASEVKLEIGEKIEGFFLEMKEVETTNPETGEVKLQTKIYMEETLGGTRFYVWGNAGLKTAIQDSCVNPKDHILIERMAKKQLSGGRTKNVYDVFQIQD